MARVRSTNTTPERRVQEALRRLRVRVSRKTARLPGHPDFVLPARRTAIFVNGCFWHRHSCRAGQKIPVANADYWARKFANNRNRDLAVRRSLRALGWRVLIVWECRTGDEDILTRRLARSLAG